MAAVIEKARREPGKLSYRSGGIGTPSHLATEQLLAAAGAQAVRVPYKGASETLNAVIGNEVDFGLMLNQVAIGRVRNGKVRGLAATGAFETDPDTASQPAALAGSSSITRTKTVLVLLNAE